MKIGITGAYGYSGKYITQRLIDKGHEIICFTNHPGDPNIFKNKVISYPLDFNNMNELQENLKGLDVFINTYWVRFNHKYFNHKEAVTNTLILFTAAKQVGINKIIHISITNPSLKSELSYFYGKAILEENLKNLGIHYSIIRPAVLFGYEDILINNMAWALRNFPLFCIFAKGDYKLQPIHIDDFSKLICQQCTRRENNIIDAIGPETYSYKALTQILRKNLNLKTPIINLPSRLAWAIAKLVGFLKKDVIITWEEIQGLEKNLLVTNSKPHGNKKLSEWIKENKMTLGLHYHNELRRR